MPDDRSILLADILGRTAARSPRIVSPADFRLGEWRAGVASAEFAKFAPYCLDLRNKRACYVEAGSAKALTAAKFQYLHLRERATRMVTAPWESLPLLPGEPMRAIFVFSVGRCGSTLLIEALREGGAVGPSEPDFYTQAVAAYLSDRAVNRDRILSRALLAMTRDLATFCSGGAKSTVFVKLRAECCRAPGLLLEPEGSRPATIFLIRDFEGWTRSMLGVTTLSPPRLVERYLEGLRCLHWLRRHTAVLLLRYEALLARPQTAIAEITNSLGIPWDPAKVKLSLRRDAQLGSPLARDSRLRKKVDEAGLAAALALWREKRPGALLEEVGLADLA